MTLVSWCRTAPWNSNGKIGSGGAEYERGMKKRPFSHCHYCIPIYQAAQLSRADPGVSRAFLLSNIVKALKAWQQQYGYCWDKQLSCGKEKQWQSICLLLINLCDISLQWMGRLQVDMIFVRLSLRKLQSRRRFTLRWGSCLARQCKLLMYDHCWLSRPLVVVLSSVMILPSVIQPAPFPPELLRYALVCQSVQVICWEALW